MNNPTNNQNQHQQQQDMPNYNMDYEETGINGDANANVAPINMDGCIGYSTFGDFNITQDLTSTIVSDPRSFDLITPPSREDSYLECSTNVQSLNNQTQNFNNIENNPNNNINNEVPDINANTYVDKNARDSTNLQQYMATSIENQGYNNNYIAPSNVEDGNNNANNNLLQQTYQIQQQKQQQQMLQPQLLNCKYFFVIIF